MILHTLKHLSVSAVTLIYGPGYFFPFFGRPGYFLLLNPVLIIFSKNLPAPTPIKIKWSLPYCSHYFGHDTGKIYILAGILVLRASEVK